MNGTDLHDHLARVVEDITPDRPFIGGLRAVARRRRQRGQRLLVGATALAAIAGGTVALAAVEPGGRRGVQASSPAGGGLPGLVSAGSVIAPRFDVGAHIERAGMYVWAVVDDGNGTSALYRGMVGSTLTQVSPRAAGVSETLSVSAARVWEVVAQDPDVRGSRDALLIERDTVTGRVLGTLDLTSRYGATAAAMVRGPVGTAVLAMTTGGAGALTLRAAVLDPDLPVGEDITDVTAPRRVPDPTSLVAGTAEPDVALLPLVTTDATGPHYAYLYGDVDGSPILDLRTGAVSRFSSGARSPRNEALERVQPLGLVDGRVIFIAPTDAGHDEVLSATPGATAPLLRSPTGQGLIAGGRVFLAQVGSAPTEAVTQLDVASLQPVGPTVTIAAQVSSSFGLYAVTVPQHDEGESDDGRYDFYAAP